MKKINVLAILILFCSVLYGHSVKLAWDCDDCGQVGYNIYRSSDGLNFFKLNSDPCLIREYCDTAQEDGILYTYYVTSVGNYDNESLPSDSLDVDSGISGDCDENGIVNSTDGLILANYLAGNVVYKPPHADTNHDCETTVTDIIAILLDLP